MEVTVKVSTFRIIVNKPSLQYRYITTLHQLHVLYKEHEKT
jgi:hypothetical protein